MKTAGIILSGIYSDKLNVIAGHRTVASLPFGGRYRHVDFILSNMVNSGITDVGIITKHNYQSLIDHLGSFQDWDLNRRRGGAKLIPPHAGGDLGDYRGKIEELRAGLPFLRELDADYVIIADTVTLCTMDLRDAVRAHARSGKDLTVVATAVRSDDDELSELVFDLSGNEPERIYLNYAAKKGQLSSDGIYVVGREFLIGEIEKFASSGYYHFERDLIQQGFNTGALSVGIFEFGGVILKNRTVPEYFANNLALLDPDIRAGLFRPERPVYTAVRDEKPARYGEGSSVSDCIVADGAKVFGSARRSVLSRRVTIEDGAEVANSVILDGCVIRSGARVENAILDRYVEVGPGCFIRGSAGSPIIIEKGKKLTE